MTSLNFFGGVGETRMLWHPAVHEHFDERCHILLVSGAYGQGRHVIDGLGTLFADLDLTPSAMNIVYGPYDVLVRIWMTGPAKTRVRNALRTSAASLRIDNWLEFEVDEMMYVRDSTPWEVSISDAALHAGEVRQVVEAQRDERIKSPEYSKQLRALEGAGLVRETVSPTGAKFYMFISSMAKNEQYPSSFVLGRLREACISLGLEKRGLTLHHGVGFCEYVVKAVSTNYDDTLRLVQVIQSVCAQIKLQAWSLVMADYGARQEGDTVDAVLIEMPKRLEPFTSRVANPTEIRRLIQTLSPQEQAALADVFDEARKRYGSRFRELERFCELLEGTLTQDRRVLNQTLSFLTSIEGDLRVAIPRLVARYTDDSTFWASEVRRRAQRLNDSEPEPASLERSHTGAYNGATLALLLDVMREVDEKYGEIASILTEHLGRDWRKSTRTVLELRNAYAHSRLTETLRSREYGGTLGDVLALLAAAIGFQVGLEELVDRMNDQSP